MALCSACCLGVWIKKLLSDCGVNQIEAIPIYCDNRSCIVIARNPVIHGKNKHIDVKYHYIQELVAENEIQLEFCKSKEQLVDVLTKSLDTKKQMQFREGVCDFQSRGSC